MRQPRGGIHSSDELRRWTFCVVPGSDFRRLPLPFGARVPLWNITPGLMLVCQAHGAFSTVPAAILRPTLIRS